MAMYQSKYTGKEIDDAIANQKTMSEIVIRNSKQIENLKQGSADQFETDTAVAYVKNVPENALPYAAINKIGGMTYKDGNTLKSAKVTEVESVGVNLLKTVNGTHILPNGVGLTLDNGYFEMKITDSVIEMSSTWWHQYTTVRLQAGTYTMSLSNFKGSNCTLFFANKTDNVDLRSEVEAKNGSWNFTVNKETDVAFGLYIYHPSGITETVSGEFMLNKGSTALPYAPYVKHTLPIPEAVRNKSWYGLSIPNSDVYNSIVWNENGSVDGDIKCAVVDLGTLDWSMTDTLGLATVSDMSLTPKYVVGDLPSKITGFAYDGTSPIIYVFFESGAYTGTDVLKSELQGVMFVYELANPTTEDISDLITLDNLISVEGGGTITLRNEYTYAVPSEVEYQVEV